MFGRKKSAQADQPPPFHLGHKGGRHILTLPGGQGDRAVIDWIAARPDAASALGQAVAAAEEGRLAYDGDALVLSDARHLSLHPSFVSRLGAADAAALDLPGSTLLALDLRSQGRIDEKQFRVEIRWIRPGGAPVRASVDGALIDDGVAVRRIPEPLWSLHATASRLAKPLEAAERYAALARLRAAWPEDARAPIESDGFLRDLRVHHASQFSLKLGRLGPFDFDPVLFGPKASVGAEAEGRELDEDVDNVLAPTAQRLFSEDRFRREASVRPVYVLRDSEYVFIDPSLRPALDAVRRLQDAPEAERRAFVLNPRRGLRDRLGDSQANAVDLDRLFVETEQFSARVAGVDLWRAPVLPWLAPSADNGWWPKRFGLRVGEGYYVLPPENVRPLLDRVEAGLAQGSQTIGVEGLLEALPPEGLPPPKELPVTEQVREAVGAFAPFADAPPSPTGTEDSPTTSEPPPELRGKLFLIVRENLEKVEFSPLPGAAQPSGETQAAPKVPARLKTAPKPHQVSGLSWLVRAASTNRPGGLLADDMGLGKTLQAIAFMAWLQAEAEAGCRPHAPFLIVAPTGLLGNWRDEIARHLHPPHLGGLVCAFGSDLKTLKEEDAFGARDIENGRASLRAEAWGDAGLVLTTYETLRDYHFSFARTRFGLIVYDEIQKLKNPASQLSRAAKTLNGTFVLGMTGTPVENRLQDLWAITDVVSPGLLGSSRDFERRHPTGDTEALKRLKSDLTQGDPPYMLRRMKSEVLEALPRKQSIPTRRDMPDRQAKLYRDLVVRAAALAAAGTAGPGAMLQTLAALRSASLHPDDPREAAAADLDTYAQGSARLSRTLEILQDISAKGEKALLFVEDLAMQDRLASLLQARFNLPSRPYQINGGVPGPKRQEMVRAFQEGATGRFDVMILSPKAGGVGLTLTAANHVVHLSRWWNPAVEDQATDRVHRIGQTREVHVHFPMAVHPDPMIGETSFDLRLDALIARKRALTRDLFLPPESTDDDLAGLFWEVAEGRTGVDGTAASPPQEPAQVITEKAEAPAATLRPRLPGILTLPTTAQTAGARMWRRDPGAPRPTEEIIDLFAGKSLSHVCIRDPYALAQARSRKAQVTFLVHLAKRARRVEVVTLEYAPEAEGDLSESQQRMDFDAAFSRAFSSGGPRLHFSRRAKRGRGEDFHDRFVDIDVRGAGGAVLRHELYIGRGLEALYDSTKQCTVTYAPPTA